MRLIRDLDNLPNDLRGGAVAIGKFDGVHRGHAQILSRLRAWADKVDGPAVVFTFDPLPVQVIFPERQFLPLCWTERKAELLRRLRVDAMVAYPTNEEFLARSARDFFEHLIVESFGAKAVVEGENFNFGHNREGDVHLLEQLCSERGLGVEVVRPVLHEGRPISSSRIRTLLADGKIAEANALLTAPYRIRGRVVEGDRRGRTLGFPTANLEVHETLTPASGIYAGRAYLDGRHWPAAIAMGPNLTFDADATKIEVHLVGFDADIYGRELEVEFVGRLRRLVRFDSVDPLLEQMRKDVAEVVALVGEGVVP